MKKVLATIVVMVLGYSSLFCITYPSVSVRDSDGDAVSVNSNGSIDVNFVAGDDINFTYGVMAATGTFTYTVNASTFVASSHVTTPFINLNTAYEVGTDTPSYSGQLIRNAAFEVYIGTGTSNAWDWTKVGAQ